MDQRLEKALEFSNFRMILETRQQNLKLLMDNKMMLPYGGGLFKVNKELLAFIFMLMFSKGTSAIIIDENDIPIKIENMEDFAEKAAAKYDKALEQYYNSYQKLNEAREIRKVIDWDDEE